MLTYECARMPSPTNATVHILKCIVQKCPSIVPTAVLFNSPQCTYVFAVPVLVLLHHYNCIEARVQLELHSLPLPMCWTVHRWPCGHEPCKFASMYVCMYACVLPATLIVRCTVHVYVGVHMYVYTDQKQLLLTVAADSVGCRPELKQRTRIALFG